MQPLCVLGLGLIGGSLMRAASKAGREVWGAASSVDDLESAAKDGFDTESSIEAALRRADDRDAMVLLAVPLPAVSGILRKIDTLCAQIRLTDVVSVKGNVAEQVRRFSPQVRYVGGHPMAGRAESGWAAGNAELFTDAAWVVCAEEDADRDTWLAVANLALDCGSYVVPSSVAEHDAAVARISHLPHLLAAVLSSVGAEGDTLALALAAGSYRDGTRVAGSDPELVRAMCEGNRDQLLEVLDDALGRLGAARGALASTGGLSATINSGHSGYRQWQEQLAAPTVPVQIDVNARGSMAKLRELARNGGRVTRLEDGIAYGQQLGWGLLEAAPEVELAAELSLDNDPESDKD
ncbi:prephenate dehydrogenase [Pseudonocardiaceae bacterium YIM PH 21723]|nr:prephenate dehydrogenase [Pseudonocardiaceae bacterium YIM PH 21723]